MKIEEDFMNNLKLYNIPKGLSKKIGVLSLTTLLLTTTLTGCNYELASDEEYDIVNSGQNDDLSSGLTQILDIPGEDFKLVTEYNCDDESKREWRITSDKFLSIKAYTQDLPDDVSVWIDNIHVDISIKSVYAAFDGIKQDEMDDHVQNSLMLGFPIGNNINYYGEISIEGSNETFISGTAYGNGTYSKGDITEKRYTESDYIEFGVWGNKFNVVYDLLIQGPYDKDPRNVSVKTDFAVQISDSEIKYTQNGDGKELIKQKLDR